MKKITVQLFGAFRPLGTEMSFDLPDKACVDDLRTAFISALPEDFHDLIGVSRFADERTVLSENSVLQVDSIFAILPPVSGG